MTHSFHTALIQENLGSTPALCWAEEDLQIFPQQHFHDDHTADK